MAEEASPFSPQCCYSFFVREREDIWIYVTSNEGGGRKERRHLIMEKNPLLLS